MKISTKGRYALRLMVDIAVHSNGGNVPLRDISGRQGISFKYLEQIIALLCKVGYIRSMRGPSGGYKLTREPKDYSVGDILRVTEGNLAPISCLDGNGEHCERLNQCGTRNFWDGLYHVINEYIDKYTLEDLVNEYNKNQFDDYMI